MRQPSLALGAVMGGLTALPLMALLFLGEQLARLPFVPFDLFDWLARVLPGGVIAPGISAMVRVIGILNLGPMSDAAKLIEQLAGIGMMVGVGVFLGTATAWTLEHSAWSGWQVGAVGGVVALVLTSVIEVNLGIAGDPVLALLWMALLIIGWGTLLGSMLEAQAAPPLTKENRAARRAVLIKIAGGSAAVALGAWGLGRILGAQRGAAVRVKPKVTRLPQVPATPTSRHRVEPAPGTRLELTPNEEFYRIDINTRPVSIAGASWVLEVDGLFDNARPLTLSDLIAYPTVTQAITLSCISNPIGGDLIGTSNWTGVRLRDVLEDLGLRPEARELLIEGADGFYESVGMEDWMDPRTLLVYGMNGEILPVKNGFPLRIYIPDRYGMKLPKWITRIEAIDHQGPGYWVERGWSAEARPQIVSMIDTVATNSLVDGKVPVGGIAWAGDRGIHKVEVQVDGGEWVEATLLVPPLSPLTWVLWRYEWPMIGDSHTFRVRAIEGSGTVQTEKAQGVRPYGATGYHWVTVTI